MMTRIRIRRRVALLATAIAWAAAAGCVADDSSQPSDGTPTPTISPTPSGPVGAVRIAFECTAGGCGVPGRIGYRISQPPIVLVTGYIASATMAANSQNIYLSSGTNGSPRVTVSLDAPTSFDADFEPQGGGRWVTSGPVSFTATSDVATYVVPVFLDTYQP